MRYAPGKVPANPMPAAPTRPGRRPMDPAPTIQQPTAGVRPMGPAPMTGGPKPAPQIAAMNQMLAGRPPGGVSAMPPIPTNLPKMTGPLGAVGTTGGQNLPKGMTGLGAALGKPSRVNTTTDADMARKGNAKPFSSVAGSLGMGLGKKLGMKKGGKVSSASKRADGIAVKGKTKGKMV
jgi:hypothetical protein